MRVLDIKLFRELLGMKGQAFAIAAVIAGGTATYVLSSSTLDTLKTTQARLYREYRFANVFVQCKRAPRQLLERISEIEGVQPAEARVAVPGNLYLPSFPDPVTAQVLSLPNSGQPLLNRLWLKAGRLPEYGRDQEVLLSDGFANAHKIEPGASFTATIYGRRKRLTVVGIASSPEFIYQLQPGAIVPDFKSYAILWMNREPLEAAFNMKEAFNQLAVEVGRGANPEDVILRLDQTLEPYGGLGAHTRKDQISHRYLSEEFRQLTQMATMFPAIFLSVAAFLLNVVITRLMATQRSQIAILKAFGYTTPVIVGHFLKLAAMIVIIGVLMAVTPAVAQRMVIGAQQLVGTVDDRHFAAKLVEYPGKFVGDVACARDYGALWQGFEVENFVRCDAEVRPFNSWHGRPRPGGNQDMLVHRFVPP